jgi:DNA-binding SARP family transcriptional activator
MQTLHLKLLGAPEVSYGEQPVKLPTRKALALLIYLVVEQGFHSREKLVALFWPESPASLGFAALRNTLARLRAALRPAEPLLLDHDGLLAFDFATRATLDLQLVEAAVQASLADQPDIAALQAATSAYRADFLEAFSLADAPAFDDWASVQRERWHHQIGVVFEALSRQHEQRRDFEPALATTIRWVTHDRLNEAAYRRLTQVHALRGDHIAALRVYAACQAAFQAEFGMPPSSEMTALAQRIRRIHAQGGRMGATLAAPVSSGIPQPRSLSDPPFVGRTMEHTQLTSAYRAVQQGQTTIVVLQGNAGIGKTRLATEFLHWLIVQGADVLVGRAFEAVGRVSYQPIVEALRQRLEQENAPDDLLSDVWLAELSRLLPELHDRYPDLPAPSADATLARARLPEAVARLGQALAARSLT